MKTIVIKTQAELDALPDSFNEYTVIEIRSDPNTLIKVTKTRDSSSVVAWGSSRVEAFGSSSVVARGSSSVVARGSSRVEAWGSSSVVALDSSSVEACGSSRVVAWESSRVEAWESSSVVAMDSSSVVACGSSRVEAWDSSRVVAYDFVTTHILSSLVALTLFNYSIASVRGFKPKTKIIRKHKTTTIIETPEIIERSFSEWIKQGYVNADGINKKLISKKKIGNIEVFEVEEFLDRSSSFVVKKGNVFSHGKTIKEAKDSLKYKISSRDTSEFKKWKKEDIKRVDDLIRAYRVITGSCEFGVKQFCETQKLKGKYSINEVIKLTEGKFGNKQFSEFFK